VNGPEDTHTAKASFDRVSAFPRAGDAAVAEHISRQTPKALPQTGSASPTMQYSPCRGPCDWLAICHERAKDRMGADRDRGAIEFVVRVRPA